MGNSGPMKAM